MDHGSERGTPPGRGAGDAAAGRIPLAVVVVDRDGLVSHWSSGASRLFGVGRRDAVGRPAVDLLPVSGALSDDPHSDVMPDAHDPCEAYDGLGPDLETSLGGRTAYPAAGRARQFPHEDGRSGGTTGDERIDVLWWAYPLVGPGPFRLLVLAADAVRLREERGYDDVAAEHISPGFANHTELPDSDELRRRLPEILPSMGPDLSGRIVSQILELGYPVLEFSQFDRVPVTPYWGVPRRPGRSRAGAVVPQQRAAPVIPAGAERDLRVRRRARAAGVPQRGQLRHRHLARPRRDHPRGHQRRRAPLRGLRRHPSAFGGARR